MYRIYVDGLLFPIAPPSIETEINNRNETIDVARGYEINKLKYPGLTDISMEFRLPNTVYPFAIYDGDFQNAQTYIDKLEDLKKRDRQEGFDLVIVRTFDQETVEDPGSLVAPAPSIARKGTLSRSDVKAGKKTNQFSRISMDDLTISVSLEDYKITEDAEEGFDWLVQCNFKKWQKWGTKVVTKLKQTKNKLVKYSKGKKRKRKKKYKDKIKTKKGQTLWQICKAAYGHGDTWANVAIKNNKKVLQKAAKKMKIKWDGVTTDWKSRKLPAGITINLPKVTYSPKKRTKVTQKQIQQHFGDVWKNLSKSERKALENAYRRRN